MVYLFLANGFEEIEALCPLDLLRRAGVEVTTVSVGGGEWVMGAHGICVQADLPDTMYKDAKPEMIILPGGMPGAKNLDESRVVEQALLASDRTGGYLAAICAAPMVLGKRGYLKGKEATCFPGFEKYLLEATVSPKGVVQDGRVITAAGMGVAMAFGLKLVEVLKDKKTAKALSLNIQAERSQEDAE